MNSPIPASSLPAHIAIIMDGNGRWARRRGWLRIRGHRQGAEVVRSITTECAKLRIQHLTLYAFSSENWQRPEKEVSVLMQLLRDFLKSELATLQENNIRLNAIGQIDRLPVEVRMDLDEVLAATAKNDGLCLHLALSYGGRDEIVDAAKALAVQVANGQIKPEDISEATFQAHTYAGASVPDVDVVIRTAGEQRLSNFLPWQSVYAEYIAVDAFWPEFTVAQFHEALQEFALRERRFGRVLDEAPAAAPQ